MNGKKGIVHWPPAQEIVCSSCLFDIKWLKKFYSRSQEDKKTRAFDSQNKPDLHPSEFIEESL